MNTLDYWKLIAGLGLFLYGMMQLEAALQEMAGRSFKLFLKKHTTNRFSALLNGIVATALLQSSSIVLLMVIAFAGAGILTLSNSLGVILGANLGTTLTGWLVSAFGFKYQIDTFVLPMISIGSLGLIFVSRRFRFYHAFSFVTAMGLLFLGLGYMKESMGQISTAVDIQQLKNLSHLAFFLFGLVVTALIQSSSAMMSMTLSALNLNVIGLMPAAFIIIGADLGTTFTALLASLKGSSVKRRVGLAHFFFNLITDFFALLAVGILLNFIQQSLGLTDPLFTLVAFHTSFNILGVFLFFPFLGSFEKFLNRFFEKRNDQVCVFIHRVSTEVPEASIEAARRDLWRFLQSVAHFNFQQLGCRSQTKTLHKASPSFLDLLRTEQDLTNEYEKIKQIEGEMLAYFADLQKEKLDVKESGALGRYILALRNGVQSAKSIKDISHNIKEFQDSTDSFFEKTWQELRTNYLPVQNSFQKFSWNSQERVSSEVIKHSLSENDAAYEKLNNGIYKTFGTDAGNLSQVATALNVNREIYNGNRHLLEAIQEMAGA